jgi:hypothetical protein
VLLEVHDVRSVLAIIGVVHISLPPLIVTTATDLTPQECATAVAGGLKSACILPHSGTG